MDFRTPAPGSGAERRAGPDFLMVAFVRGILVGGVGLRVWCGVVWCLVRGYSSSEYDVVEMEEVEGMCMYVV